MGIISMEAAGAASGAATKTAMTRLVISAYLMHCGGAGAKGRPLRTRNSTTRKQHALASRTSGCGGCSCYLLVHRQRLLHAERLMRKSYFHRFPCTQESAFIRLRH